MAKQLNVDLNFNANTAQAKQQLQQLQQSLNQLTTSTASSGLPITPQIQEAQSAAAQLKAALSQAVNVNTGKFDLSKFNQSLKQSGTDLESVRNRLVSIGPTGQQAFLALAQSIAQAEVPMRRSSALLASIGTTLKNTLKWQLSSSMLHGFIGAVQSAYGYTQDLNESLNNIRIVTGASTAQMEKFAVEANKAAKALSASTLEYTNASLIYYQQGLDADQVKERTDVTVKMANVTGQTAQEVSDQMTAVWNNFYDGSQSIEYYADVLTKLGAATASSTDEISAGLEKFASVSKTVGLSYEYATAALATVTATTRQSADVVGTAFKTLFARLQDLKLGETLDDGTTLGTYTANLAKVGVDIKTASGELKDMDVILEETAEKWKTLDRDQQVALAKGVAGIRQYNTFISLMDNWDFMESNLATAESASGTLSEQAEIFAESWEGARKRVKAAAEAIYTDLLDDDFFIKISNGFADLLGFIDQFLDSMGGAKGLLLGLGSILLNTFSMQAAKGLENIVYNLRSFVGLTQQEAINTQNLAVNLTQGINAGDLSATGMANSGATEATTLSMQSQLELTHQIAQSKEKMTELQKMEAEAILQQNQAYADQVVLLGQKADTAHADQDVARTELFDEAAFELGATVTGEALDAIDEDIDFGDKIMEEVEQAEKAFKDGEITIDEYKAKIASIKKEVDMKSATDKKSKDGAGGYDEISGALGKLSGREGDSAKNLDLSGEVSVATTKATSRRASSRLTAKGAKTPAVDTKSIDKYIAKTKAATKADKQFAAGKKNLEKTTKNSSKAISNLTNTTQQVTQTIVKGAQAAMSLSFALTQISSIKNIWSDDTLSGGQKLLQTCMSLGMAIPMLVNGLQGMNTVLGLSTAIQGKKNALLGSYLALSQTELAAMTAEQVAQATGMSLDEAEIALSSAKAGAKLTELAASGANVAGMTAEQLVQATGMTMDQAEIVLSGLKSGANIAEAASEAGLTTTKLGGVAAGIMSIFTKGLETGATWAQVVANIALQTSMSPVLIITLALVAAIALLVAAIAGIVALINAASDAYNADAIAAANAEAAAENLAKAYEDAKAEYEEMIAAMDKYESAREGLAELTKGTKEYQEALEEANNAALELIQNYPEYFGEGDYQWKDGELILNEAAMERAKETERQQVQDAHAAATMADAGAKQARAVANQTELRREIRDDNGLGDGDLVWKGIGSALVGSVVGGLAGLIPGIGPAIAPAVGGAVSGALIGSEVARAAAYDDAINKAMEVYADDSNLFSSQDYLAEKMAEVGVTNTELITALWENRNSLNELGQEFSAAALSMKVAAENVAQNIVANDAVVSQHEQSDEIAGALARSYQGNYEAEQAKALKDIKSRGLFNTGTKEAKAVMAEYAKATGLDQDSNYEVTNYVGDGTVKIKKTLDDGSVEEVTVTAEEIAAQVAASRAGAAAEGAMNTIMSDFENLKLMQEDTENQYTAQQQAAAGGLRDFLSDGDLKGATKEELGALDAMMVKGDGTEEGDAAALKASAENLDAMLAGSAQDYGFESFEAMAKALQEEAEKTEKAWENIDLPDDLKNVAELSLEAAQAVEKDINTISSGPNGENNAQAYTDFINEVTSQMGDADAEKFMNQIGNIDWSDWYAMDDVSAMLEDMGYSLDMTTPEMQAFIETMRQAGGASPAEMIQKTKDSIDALGSTLSEGIAPGSLLDEETYKQLIERNAELAGSFQKTIDGSYQYVGSDVLGIEQLGIGDALDEARENTEIYENAKEAASDIDFLGMSTAKYTSAESMASYQKNIDDKQAVINAENAKNNDWNLFTWTDQAAVTSAQQAIDQNKQLMEQAKAQNEAIIKEMNESATKILNDESLMAVAEKMGYTADEIKEIQAGVVAGNEESIEKMRVFSERFNAYMAAGDAGEYDASEFEEMIASTAKSVEELDQLTQQYGLSAETYNKAWSGLNEAEKWEGVDVEAMKDYSEHLQNVAGDSELVSAELALNSKAAETVARSTMKMNNGISKLADGIEDWSSVLKKSDKASQEYSEAMADMKDAMSDVLGVADRFLTDDFIVENLEDIEKAAEGDAEAIDRLALAAGRSIIMNLDIQDEGIEAKVLGLHDKLAAEMPDLKVGATLDDGDFLAKAQEIVSTAGMTVDEANAYFSAMGFEPEFVTEEKDVEQTNPITVTETKVRGYNTGTATMPDGSTKAWEQPILEQSTYQDGSVTTTGKMSVIAMSADGKTPQIKSLTRKSSGAMNNNSSRNAGGKSGGGGGGDKSKADKVKKSDVVDRYKEISDAIDDNADAMNKASRAADRLYGSDRLAKMREVNKLLQKEIDLTKKKRQEAEKYLIEDKKALEDAAKEAGVNFNFDNSGNISNYTEEMSKLFTQLDNAINMANADGNADENEQKTIDDIQAKIDALKDAMATYEDTRELIEDLDAELEEKFNEWQDANFEILNTELELKIEINDMDLQRIEYYLGKIEDDFYQMAEAAALMVFDSNGSWGGQLTSYTDQLASQAQYLADLETKYRNNEISQASYIEGLKNASSAIYEQLGSLQELDATMMEYYSETLAAAGEEIAKYTDLMESASGVLEHYTSLAELMGKSTDYKYMGNILSSQAKVASDAYKVSKANYDMLKGQEADREKAYKDAVARDASEEELELLEKQWWDARAATAEAQDQMLSDAEAWGEALGAILDNALSKAAQALENTLADGFGSFDAMNSAFERKNALQEEYLTTTNKIYETNKMMRTAQQEIDKTTNEAAKRKLKQFINETDALQDQTELSQYELEIQQMKYDLLLAEIALEEAQNAKSTVRLQRDNEGNMSYVYTADANKVADAQQKFEDAQNALYNKGLEGANDYVQKYQETMQEMYDTLTEIDQNYRDGAYESELEYQNAIEEAKEYYYKKLTQYSNLYQVALTTDTRVAADAWTTEFASMTERTGDWMIAVDGYVAEVTKAFGEWKSGMDLIHTDTLANIDQDLQNIESDSGELATTVTETLIPALEAEMDAVADVTEKYATFREELEKITTEYEEMAKAAENAIKVANGLEDGTDTGSPGDGSENDQDGDDSKGDNSSGGDNSSDNSSGLTWERVKQAYNKIMSGSWGNGVSHRVDEGKKDGYTEAEVRKAQELVNLVYGGKSMSQAKSALGFDTGGYTGDWSGSYGKLAFLHKKELILKQGDTENFLASMEILERILQMIDLQATSAQLGGILTTPKFSHYNDGILEQNVHIEASFPGVTDHNEVELAMTNLINTASQYANRK